MIKKKKKLHKVSNKAGSKKTEGRRNEERSENNWCYLNQKTKLPNAKIFEISFNVFVHTCLFIIKKYLAYCY